MYSILRILLFRVVLIPKPFSKSMHLAREPANLDADSTLPSEICQACSQRMQLDLLVTGVVGG